MSRQYITVQEAAEHLGHTPDAVRKHIKRGNLPAKKFGSVWMIREVDLKLIEGSKPGRPPKDK